jgi:phage shock protein PspC (stress-responsive transcriptional regulator)
MRRVITISLNGNAYQLEDDACELLSTYLDEAARALAPDPDRQEIIADLEQAIADKCARFLGAHKGVLARAEIAQVIAEMGPVDGAAAPAGGTAGGGASGAAGNGGTGTGAASGGAAGGAPGAARTEPRRLYQISEGAVISGVCNGLAAYFDVDVTLVRVLAVAIAFLSAGLAVLAYLVLMFVVPYASTSEERAAAHGLPFNARTLVERAKAKYREFARDAAGHASRQAGDPGARHEWRNGWRQARAEMRAARRHARAQWRAHWQWRAAGAPPAAAYAPAPASYGVHVLTRLLMAVVGLVLAAFMVAWLLAFLSYLNSGTFFGLVVPFQAPGWVVIVALFVLYGMVTGPLRAVRRAAATPWHPYPGAWIAALDGLLMFGAIIALLVYASHHPGEIQAFFGHLRDWLQGLTRPSPPASAT